MANYVEKYFPLKVQHQINETVGECISAKHKIRFSEISTLMSDTLRHEIMSDLGNTKFKNKVLDLIEKVRLEADMLNASKTAKLPEVERAIKPRMIDAKNYDKNGIEKLGVDEGG